jgi:hypothetical protein
MNKIKFNYQFFLVKFPIIFPAIYAFILFQFPSLETILIITTVFILAETHFGATWPFFLDKINYPFITKNRIPLIIMPMFIIIFSLIGFFFFNKFFLLIFLAINMYHVTRQSVGVFKLYSKNILENNCQERLTYLFNLAFFLIAFFKFYIPVINENNNLIVNIFFIILFFLITIYYLNKFKFSENFFIFMTGCLIFAPVLFVNNPIHVITMGVTMHYTQYLYLTYSVYSSRKSSLTLINPINFFNKNYSFFIMIFFYSVFMTFFSFSNEFNLKNLILIPIIGQMLHFYLDSQLWKFSEKYNRDNTLIHLKKFI